MYSVTGRGKEGKRNKTTQQAIQHQSCVALFESIEANGKLQGIHFTDTRHNEEQMHFVQVTKNKKLHKHKYPKHASTTYSYLTYLSLLA